MILIKVNPFYPEEEKIKVAAKAIRSGNLVAFPTETVYGLGADAFNENAVRKIFEAKNRPADNPLIIHIASIEQFFEIVDTEQAKEIENVANKVWPGPITFVAKKKEGCKIARSATAGLSTVAVRMPAHPVALALIRQSGVPIAAPSANLATKPSATKAEHVFEEFKDKVDVLLDAGNTFYGLESTIIDITRNPPALLRPGPFTVEELERIFGRIEVSEGARGLKTADVPIAPGMKYRHYAPDKPLVLCDKDKIAKAIDDAKNKGLKPILLVSNETASHFNGVDAIALGSEQNMYEIAKNLFDALKRLDKTDADIGIAQTFPERGIGLAIMNRLRKAASVKD